MNTKNQKLSGLMKTHHCGELRSENTGETVELCGWLTKHRDLGSLHFIDLRDKYGVTQLSFDQFQGSLDILNSFSLESVLWVKGEVRSRPAEAQNKDMATGEIEIAVKEIKELSHAQEPPFLPHGAMTANEDLRLKYRYLDLRTNRLQKMIRVRSETAMNARSVLYSHGFLEVDTPILYKTTPEGARDYVVPSRVHKGKVYALPQSPQTLKQLLMIGNTDKYFQICRCFRDEDLRADRQPEFSQIDIEVSFANQEYLKNLAIEIVKKTFKFDDNFSIPTMPYQEAMKLYGSDKPDVRFGLIHQSVGDLFKESSFKTFAEIAKQDGLIKSIFVSTEQGTFARKEIDKFVDVVKPYGGKGVAWFKVTGDEMSGGISKFVTPEIMKTLRERHEGKGDGIFLFFADPKEDVVHNCADAMRRHLGKTLELYNSSDYAFLWVNDFPLYEYDDEDQRFYAKHHPFTMPKLDQLDDYNSDDPKRIKDIVADAYDLVCNGYELGGGSLRIYDETIQKRMFEILGMDKEEVQHQFGFFVEALKYGTPPHAGMAFGLDRLVMLISGTDSIRDVIAFPKTNNATDLMANAPSVPDVDQYKELGLKVDLD